MKRKVISSKPDLPILEAAKLLVYHHIGCLPIVNENSELIGLVRIRDLITLAMPDFINLVDNVDFVRDFGAVEDDIPDCAVLNAPISSVMGDPVAVEASAGLVRVIALLQEHAMNDMPVVDEDHHLVGIASYVDIGVALLSNWKSE
jgi:CBS-domain-containing membrane protein